MEDRRHFINRPGATVLLYAIFLHVIWGSIFFFTSRRIVTMPTYYLTTHVGQVRAGVILILAAALSTWGLKRPGRWGFVATLPQNALLLISGTTAALLAFAGHYPDGIVRPTTFILVDQMPAIAAAVLHCVAIVIYHGGAARLKVPWR